MNNGHLDCLQSWMIQQGNLWEAPKINFAGIQSKITDFDIFDNAERPTGSGAQQARMFSFGATDNYLSLTHLTLRQSGVKIHSIDSSHNSISITGSLEFHTVFEASAETFVLTAKVCKGLQVYVNATKAVSEDEHEDMIDQSIHRETARSQVICQKLTLKKRSLLLGGRHAPKLWAYWLRQYFSKSWSNNQCKFHCCWRGCEAGARYRGFCW